MVASTRESVTKALSEMRNRGAIKVQSRRITLKDFGRLETQQGLIAVSTLAADE